MAIEKFVPQIDLKKPNGNEWHALGLEDVLDELDTLADIGLSDEEAAKRLEQYGPNQLAEKPSVSFWKMLWDQFNNFVVMMLIVASVVSAFLGDYVEAAAIMAIVILNAALGVFQERRAEQALAALKKLAAPEAHVIRSNSRKTIPSSQVVPGDLVLLEAGNYVPADIRLVEAVNLRAEEAALTGESVPVQKDASIRLEAQIPLGDRKNTAFMGTLVSYGRGRGVVISTGMHTQIGLIAEMLQSVEEEETPLQKRLDQLGKTLGWAALTICGIVFAVGWLRGYDPLDMFLIAVSLAIAAVPEGLPAVVTISLALGMREMIKRHALIRKLSSVETLGSTTVICSDKTGTLTQNEMTATRMWAAGKIFSISGIGYAPVGDFSIDHQPINIKDYPAALTNLWVAALNNDAGVEVSGESDDKRTYRMVGDPTEGALIVAAAKTGASQQELNQAYPRVQEVPFDSVRKRMTTIHKIAAPRAEDISPFSDAAKKEWHVITVKGALDLVLDLCGSYQGMDNRIEPLDETTRMQILAANDLMTQDALRVLGMAYRLTSDLPDASDPDSLE
ncbi:MAG: HAD-IC family P-type ATPase, partial [Anaerolineales bacterium]|nr:HAD-IC family P-type ATPase [Anaerolineales bacterium]